MGEVSATVRLRKESKGAWPGTHRIIKILVR